MSKHVRTLALVAALCGIGFTSAQPSVSSTPLVLNVTPDFAVVGGDVIGFSFSGGTPSAFMYLLVSATPGNLPLGPVMLQVGYPFYVVDGGIVNPQGIVSGGMTVPGTGPLAGLSGLTLHLQGVSVKAVSGEVVWQASNRDSVHFQ
jgi:hypothetical protein